MEGTRVCTWERAVSTLLKHLVDPNLPRNLHGEDVSLSDDQEEQLVAKQMHAVALLYNYYHRRQHAEQSALDWDSLCHWALIESPGLQSFMDRTTSDSEEDDPRVPLSLTEERIMDACDVAMSLEASKDKAPAIRRGSVITGVAVLLVDSTKQNALLQFGSITEGVWSAFEKDVEDGNSTDRHLFWQSNKRKRGVKDPPPKRRRRVSEAGMKKLAALAVNEATGIRRGELSFMESHVVYSTSKANTLTRFYILQCTTQAENSISSSSSNVSPVPIKDLITRLQGSLFTLTSNGRWTISPVVEYFHLLPFAGILADWMTMNSA